MIVLSAGCAGLARLMSADARPAPSEPGPGRQASSTAMATASPPPMHRLAMPFLPPRA